ncbi:TPA: adhesin biosynthesis transcription regulatory family protein [Salmonella enterica]|nr:transcriptional regulator [Salmonella enterica]HBK1093726.1 adhesin biosynthesis transcription regulatory family protein [Salmonella enterica]
MKRYNALKTSENIRLDYFLKKRGILPGTIDEEHFWLLMEILPIHSEKVICAMRDHLISGISRKEVCQKYSVNNGYLSISISRLNYVHQIVMNMVHYYTDT